MERRPARLRVALLALALAGVLGVGSARRVASERRALRDLDIAQELIAMREEDQRVRHVFLGRIPDSQPRTPTRVAELNDQRDALDRANIAHLSRLLEEIGGWPTISRFGDLASQSACVVAVHAVEDWDFMQRAQEQMSPHVPEGEVNVECWAQVTDRLLVQRGELQRFGTQLRGRELDGRWHWGIAPVLDPDALLARRAEVGLGSYEEYLHRQRRDYRIPEDAPPFPDEPQIPGMSARALLGLDELPAAPTAP